MAIEIPSEVVFFLNMVGVPYPDINEDDVRALAEHVRTFATSVADTHQSATGAVKEMGSVYSGYSYEQLVVSWAAMSTTHMADLDRACRFVAKALDIAAEVITVVKVAVLAELAVLAVTYLTVMATPGMAMAGPTVATAARRLCDQMTQMLVAYIIAEVIGKAIEPLEHTIEQMINGVVYEAARNALGVPDSTSSPTLRIEPDEVRRYAKVLDDHADAILDHAATFAANVAPLDFTTPVRWDAGTFDSAPPRDGGGPSGASLPPRVDGGSPVGQRYPSESPRGIAQPQLTDRPSAGADRRGGDMGRPFDGRQSAGSSEHRAESSGRPAAGATQPSGSSAPPSISADRPNDAPGQSDKAAGGPQARAGDAASRGDIGSENRGDSGSEKRGLGRENAVAAAAGGQDDGTRFGSRPGAQVSMAAEAPNAPTAASGQPVVGIGDHQPVSASEPAGGSAPPRPQAGRGSGPATPWGRAKRSKSSKSPKSSKSSKSLPSKALPSSGAAPLVAGSTGKTPWSKARRKSEVVPGVFAPAVTAAPSRRRPEQTAEGNSDAAVAADAATHAEVTPGPPSGASGPPPVAVPAVTAPPVIAPTVTAPDAEKGPTPR
ncbi:hypothetical protein ACFQZZ_24335 [Nocardia sp. GCM10030253]|uniref:WXG100-like domain-containing protein n=1 Tax=Nocardia sp. GCM10030253 TaxID=3273404 RepID=UPI00362A5DBD